MRSCPKAFLIFGLMRRLVAKIDKLRSTGDLMLPSLLSEHINLKAIDI